MIETIVDTISTIFWMGIFIASIAFAVVVVIENIMEWLKK